MNGEIALVLAVMLIAWVAWVALSHSKFDL